MTIPAITADTITAADIRMVDVAPTLVPLHREALFAEAEAFFHEHGDKIRRDLSTYRGLGRGPLWISVPKESPVGLAGATIYGLPVRPFDTIGAPWSLRWSPVPPLPPLPPLPLPEPEPVAERPSWDEYGLAFADAAALRADCRRRKVGCAIFTPDHRIIAAGYNGAPAGRPGCLSGACPRGLLSYDEVAEFTDYDTGPGRCISVHDAPNALLHAGLAARGGTAYSTDPPCPTCRKLFAAAGIVRVVWRKDGRIEEIVP